MKHKLECKIYTLFQINKEPFGTATHSHSSLLLPAVFFVVAQVRHGELALVLHSQLFEVLVGASVAQRQDYQIPHTNTRCYVLLLHNGVDNERKVLAKLNPAEEQERQDQFVYILCNAHNRADGED